MEYGNLQDARYSVSDMLRHEVEAARPPKPRNVSIRLATIP